MTDAELAALADADPRTLPAALLLDGYVDALRRAPLTSPGPELGRAVALRAELLRRLADRDLIALRQDVVRLLEALAAIRREAARPRPQGGWCAALKQIEAAATAALAASEVTP